MIDRGKLMRWSIVAPWLLTVGLFVALVGVAAVAGQHPEFGGGGTAALVAFFGLIGVWGVANATVGAIIASRRPEIRIGRILQAGGPLVIGVFLGFLVSATRSLAAGPGDLLGALAGWWAAVSIFPAILIAWPLVAVLFPDGRLPGPHWRWPAILVAVGEVAVSGIAAITVGPVAPGLPDNPFGVLNLASSSVAILGLIGTALVVLSLALAFLAIAVRWRQGNRLVRAQLKWLLGALAVGGILFPIGFGGDVVNVLDFLGVGSATLVPIAIGIAVLRYRLYDIDRIVSRTIAYVIVTGVLGAVFAIVVVGLQAILVTVTENGGIPIAVSTLVVVALLQPLRRRVQRAVDRRFDRARYDADQTVRTFASRLRGNLDLGAVSAEILGTATSAVRPTAASIWLRGTSR